MSKKYLLFDAVLPMLLNTKVKDISSRATRLTNKKNHNSTFLCDVIKYPAERIT